MRIDWKALCAEQLPELRGMFERILCVARSTGGPTCRPVGNIELADRLIDAVVSWSENSLAQPEPEGPPTDEDARFLLWKTPPDEQLDDLQQKIERVFSEFQHRHFARAVLARWGRPTIEPVPVSERLPGPEDCDEEGRCWWFNVAGVPEWQLAGGGSYGEAWLPHHALPITANQ